MATREELYEASSSLLDVITRARGRSFNDLAENLLYRKVGGVYSEPCYRGMSTGLKLSYELSSGPQVSVVVAQLQVDNHLLIIPRENNKGFEVRKEKSLDLILEELRKMADATRPVEASRSQKVCLNRD